MLARIVFFAVVVALGNSETDDILLAKAHNTLAVNLLKHLASQNPSENVFISPTSIAAAFGMAYAGARGASQDELASALGHTAFGLTERPRVLAAYKKLLDLAASPNVTLEVANMVLAQNNFHVSDSYKQQLQEIFDAELRSVDFANDGPRVAAQVNAWVREKTRGKITSILPEGQPLNVILFILNAIYFKGTWVTKFDPSRTEPKPFFNEGITEVTKPAMNLDNSFPYAKISSLNAAAVEIPYEGGAFSMVVLLPDSRTGLGQLRDKLSLPVVEDIPNQLSHHDVILRLPKFEMSLRYNLVPAMRAMGLDGVFGNSADFAGISDSTSVRISDAVHKAAVEVNEEGSVATAVTGVFLVPISAHFRPLPPVEFIVDHPFIFYIRDRRTNRVLFIGEVNHL